MYCTKKFLFLLTNFCPISHFIFEINHYSLPMINLGYALSSEEHNPNQLIEQAIKAEKSGFTFALISDHFHPWIEQQGQSPFVWTVLGGISQKTTNLRLGTGVTCPIIRVHPVIIAQAAATSASLLEGRFFLGLGTGENLNEHVVGIGWPPINDRQDMLIEAVEIIRMLWEGDYKTYYGNFYTVEDARIFTLPKTLPDIYIAASGVKSASIAGAIGDGLISTTPQQDLVKTFEESGGRGKPTLGQLTVVVAESEEEGLDIAMQYWPIAALPGQLSQELRLPKYFEQAIQLITPDRLREHLVLGNNPEKHLEKIQQFADAGFDHIYVHQIGPNQDIFFRFYEKEILPRIDQISPKKSQKEMMQPKGIKIQI